MQKITHPFEPIFNKDSRILILGSFPSVKSRENSFYYGHPRNRFWRLISELTGGPAPETIEEKKRLLQMGGIALWDVIHSCDIQGSSDSSIKNVTPNDLRPVIAGSKIQKIYANGSTAGRLYRKFCEKEINLPIVILPSTSPANASYSFERLLGAWRAELEYDML